jgi:hypothetical protein
MPLFEYRCPVGHQRIVHERADSILCGSDCSEIARRRFSFSVLTPIQEHFNLATGTYVSNEQQVKDELKRQSDDLSARTGFNHDFQYLSPSDMQDVAARKVTPEGLNEQGLRNYEKLAK